MSNLQLGTGNFNLAAGRHGGCPAAPENSRKELKMKWYQSNPARLEMEKGLLGRSHPGVKLVIKNGKMRVVTELRTGKAQYLIEAIFPNNFPYSAMEVYVREPRLESPPHVYGENRLCLHECNDIGPETTAKIYLDWTKQWIATYEKWLDGDRKSVV